MVAASHNDVLTELYADLGDLLRDYLRGDVGPELRPENHMDHGRLVEAIRAGDAETAAAEAASHALKWLEPRTGPDAGPDTDASGEPRPAPDGASRTATTG